MTDRLAGTNVTAEQRAALLDKVPSKIGDWRGDDIPVDPTVRKKAGAVGAVQREYHNVRTGEKVRLWLIVGHAREVSYTDLEFLRDEMSHKFIGQDWNHDLGPAEWMQLEYRPATRSLG